MAPKQQTQVDEACEKTFRFHITLKRRYAVVIQSLVRKWGKDTKPSDVIKTIIEQAKQAKLECLEDWDKE